MIVAASPWGVNRVTGARALECNGHPRRPIQMVARHFIVRLIKLERHEPPSPQKVSQATAAP
jgi:hypothetical protein